MKRVFIDLVVVPLSGRQAILKDKNGRIKLFLKSPPEGGKANCELVKYIAGILGLVQQDVSIVNGATSRKKDSGCNSVDFRSSVTVIGY